MKTFISSAQTLALIAVASFAASGCTKETSTRRTHEPAQTQAADVATASSRNDLTVQTTPEDAALFLRKFKVQVSRERLELLLRETSVEKRNELFSAIETAGQMVETLAPGAERSGLVNAFMAAAQTGCDEKLNGCRFISLFRRQPGGVTLALASLEETGKTASDRLRALSMAFAMVGQVEDPRIARAYLRSTPAIESTTSNLKLGSLKDRHTEVVEHSLRSLSKAVTTAQSENRAVDIESTKVLEELAQAWDIFNFARVRTPENSARETLLFSIVSSKVLQNEELSKQTLSSQQIDNSITNKISRTAAPAKKAFGLAESFENDLHLFIFDSLWLGRITINEADILWNAHVAQQGSNSSSDLRLTAQTALLNYFKSRLLTTSKDVNGIIIDFFNSKGKFITANAFQDGLKETLKGATIWADARRRFETLQEFNERNLRSTNFDVRSTKDLEQFMASLDQNIKVLSTYPSMLIMAYHLARLDFSLKVYTWTGSFEIKAGLILDWFFNGTMSPWMSYSNNARGLTKSEISQVFYYALEMGVLTEGGVNLDELFKMLTEQMIGPLRADVQKIDESFRTAFEEDPLVNDFRRLCDLQKTTGNPADAVPAIALKDLRFFTTSGIPQIGLSHYLHPTLGSAWALFEADQKGTTRRLDENLEIIRLEFTPKINHLRSLYRMVDDYLSRHGVSDRSKTLESINTRIEALEILRKKTYSRMFKLVKGIGPCGEQAIEHELGSQVHAIEGLIAHFKLVHSEMRALRKGSPTEALNKKFGFTGKVAIQGLEAHESGLGFNGDMYRLSRLQVLLRMTDILEAGFNDGTTTKAARRRKGSVTIPSRLQDVENALRADTLRLDWNDSADEFVTNGIHQLFDRRSNFIMWSGMNSPALSVKGRIRAMAALAKAGSVDTDLGTQKFEMKEVARLSLKMAKWFEVENSVWTHVLNVNGEYTRLDLYAILDGFVREKGTHNWIGTLDFMFKQLTSDKLGDGEADESDSQSPRFTARMGPREDYKRHAFTIRALSQPALNIPAATMANLTELYKGSLDQDIELIGEFLEEASRLEVLRKERPDVFPAWRIYSSRKSPDVPVLTVSAIEHFRSHLLEFSRQTGYVIPARTDAALKAR